MNQILAALLNAQPATTTPSSTQASSDTSSSADSGSSTQFKSQFDQAVQTLATIAQANAAKTSSTQGSTATQGAAQATTAGSTVQSASAADSLQIALQKKIADLLAKGESVKEIVQQLAAALAQQVAQQFGGNVADIQNQLQTAFASALTPPTGTGPPPSTADLASALAQRFRQVADVAAGVLGETGQSNRLFAGSNLDAATTAGVQPAPTTTTPSVTPPVADQSTTGVADSMAQSAQALLATLIASHGDGKTVAANSTTAGQPTQPARSTTTRVTDPSATPLVTAQATTPLVTAQATTPLVTAQATTPLVTAQATTPLVTDQSATPPVADQSVAAQSATPPASAQSTTLPVTDQSTTTVAGSTPLSAQALLAALTASQGDGKTVVTTGTNVGANGDTLLGRILARAQQAAQNRAPAQPQDQTPVTIPTGSSTLTSMALAAATVSLSAANAVSAPDPSAAAAQRILANANANLTDSSAMPVTEAAPAPLNPAVTAFLKSFSDALALANTPAPAKSANVNGTTSTSDPGTLLTTSVNSSQAPTIGAFAPVQAAIGNDAAATSSQAPAQPSSSQPAVDSSSVVDQLLHGVFMNTVGDLSTVRLRLQPETLGDISVKLTIQGSNVSASIVAQTPAAHDALVAGQAQLTRTFADAGLKLSSFTVDLAGGFASFQQQQQQQSSQNGTSNGRTGLLGGVDTPETDENALVAAPNFGPPVMAANQNWAALNYLA